MALIPLKIPAGVYRIGTDYEGSGRWRDANLVYYVELEDGAPPTVLQTDAGLLYPDVKEGQALIFPSVFYHTSPKNESSSTKTVIATNLNVE